MPRKNQTKINPPAATETTKAKRPLALSDERTPRLRRDQLMKYRALQAEARAAEANTRAARSAHENARLTFELICRKYPEVMSANAAVLTAKQTADEARQAEQAAKKVANEYTLELGREHKVDMHNVAIDDDTGLIREMPLSVAEGGPAPAGDKT